MLISAFLIRSILSSAESLHSAHEELGMCVTTASSTRYSAGASVCMKILQFELSRRVAISNRKWKKINLLIPSLCKLVAFYIHVLY